MKKVLIGLGLAAGGYWFYHRHRAASPAEASAALAKLMTADEVTIPTANWYPQAMRATLATAYLKGMPDQLKSTALSLEGKGYLKTAAAFRAKAGA